MDLGQNIRSSRISVLKLPDKQSNRPISKTGDFTKSKSSMYVTNETLIHVKHTISCFNNFQVLILTFDK